MKRGIYIFAVLIASMALLAHILIPHHHHENEICFAPDTHHHTDCDHNIQDSAEYEDPDHKGSACDHDAEGPEQHHNCLMDVEIILPPHQDRSFAENIIYSDDHSDFLGNPYLLVKQLVVDQIPPGEHISHGPLIILFYSRSVTGSPGLRAPPSC